MGGFSSSVINGQHVKYGDLCEVEIGWGDDYRKILTTFVETSEDGDHWFHCVREEDKVGGDSYFSDMYAAVQSVRVIGKETPEMFCSEGI